MARITREPGLNSGLPDNDGLDDHTRAAMQAAANKVSGEGVIVGGVQDMQKFFGELAKDDAEPAVNIPPGEDETSPTSMEHAAATDAVATGTARFDDSYTVEELKAELDARGEPVSGTKQELIDRLNG